ncbi:Na+/Pi symporter [Sporothrix eucalyptigena]|uniref:Phosphate transporter n=1 Tax=Sporothrix eucalyptigena TaxID=1812306 RepID=A0ABP0BHD6_9PEZI
MTRLLQYNHLFALGTIFAFLDAWNIGANDVANSWATSVSSRSVTYLQAMCLASVMEFGGAVGVGARVADTIRTKVVNTELYADTPAMLMLGMVCAIIASSLYLTFATKIGFPVSTTHSIMGGVIGMGIASVGVHGIQWVGSGGGTGVINSGVVQVFMAWILAPGISAIFGAIIFTITKYVVMLRSNPVYKALMTVPVYFGVTASLLTMLLLWKGGSYTVRLTDAQIAGVIVGVGAAWGIFVAIFLCPWLYCKVIRDDWKIKAYHLPLGPLNLRRPDAGPPPVGYNGTRNFYSGHLTKEELEAKRSVFQDQAASPRQGTLDEESGQGDDSPEMKNLNTANVTGITNEGVFADAQDGSRLPPAAGTQEPRKSIVGPKPDGKWYTGPVLFWYFKHAIFRGVDVDIISSQNDRHTLLTGDLEEMHARAAHYDNKTEYMFTFLQVMTAATASFTHGANDIANAIGPYATIFEIWNDGVLPAKGKAQVPIWILVFGASALVIGLWTYGYHIMRNLGNRITLHSPSRGFSMELASATTIIIATRLKLPVSTTQCITGATVGVGLCSGTWRTINWRMVLWIYAGWVITLPCTGLISGLLMAFIIHSPRW